MLSQTGVMLSMIPMHVHFDCDICMSAACWLEPAVGQALHVQLLPDLQMFDLGDVSTCAQACV